MRMSVLSWLFLGFVVLVIGLFVTPTYAEVVDCDETPDAALCKGLAEATKRYGGCDENPYSALQREGFISGRNVVPRQVGNTLVDGIDPALACRLLQFFRAAKACNPKIGSAYRSNSDQARACIGVCGNPNGCSSGCARPGTSCHQRGLAVDITSSCSEKMSREARRYNLISRIPGYPNPNHYQCIEHGRSAGVSSCTGPCKGGLAITAGPDDFQPSNSPSSGIANQFRNMFTPQPAPVGQPAPQQPQQVAPQQQPPLTGQNTTPQVPGTCAPQFYCTNNDLYYRASTCVDQLYQKCPAGCSGVACNVSPSLSTNLLSLSFSTTSPRGGTSGPGDERAATTSVYDRILDVAGYTPQPASTPSTEPLVLTIDGEDAVRLQQTGDPRLEPLNEPQYNAQAPGSQQTFTSGDLSQSPVRQYPSGQFSTFQRTLSTMKETLLNVLSYLKPFGRPASAGEGETYHME